MQLRQSRKQFLAGLEQVHFNLTAVGIAGLPLDELQRFAS